MMNALNFLIAVTFVLTLAACTPAPTELPTHPTNPPTHESFQLVPTLTETPTEVPQPYPVDTKIPITPHAYPYPVIWPTETPIPTPSPTSTHIVSEPPEPLDRTSLQSILNWVQYSLAHEDTSVFDSLASEEVWYGPTESEYIGAYTKEEFTSELALRLPNHPVCDSYESRQGEIRVIYIFITNWDPPWVFEGYEGVFTGLVLGFSDHGSENGELILTGIGVTNLLRAFFEPKPCP